MNIFISYRRDDSSGYAGRLYDRLAAHFGRPNVFMDIEALEPGVDFVEGIDQAMASCGALVVLIGSEWLSATDARGRRRLDNPNDFIRLEVANALRRDLCVLPVLVNGAAMPTEEELPPELAPLARRQAQELSNTRWDYDVGRLIAALERWLSRAADKTSGDQASEEAGDTGGMGSGAATPRTPAWVWPAVALLLAVLAWGAVTWFRGAPSEAPAGPPAEPSSQPPTPELPQQAPTPPGPAPAQPLPAAPASLEPAPPATTLPEPMPPEPMPPEPTPPEPPPPEPPPPEPTPPEPPPAEPPAPPDTAARIERLLEQAEADFRADRLTRPPGANAQLRYLEVLELAPEHPAALAGLRRLGYRYLELAAVALERGRRDQAQAYLDQAQRLVPGEPELAKLRERAAAPPPRSDRGPEPKPAPDIEMRQQCLEACDAAFAACREEAQIASGVEACMRERRQQCEAELNTCKGDPQKLFVWGQVGTDSACNGEYHQCMQRAELECRQAQVDGLRACEVEAGECRRQCPGQ